MSSSDSSVTTTRDKGYSTCVIALDFVIRNALQSDPNTYNKYISEFARSDICDQMKCLSSEDYSIRQLMNHKHLKKEITETMGALILAERAAFNYFRKGKEIFTGRFSDILQSLLDDLKFESLRLLREMGNRVLIYDICSGKGITSFIATFLLPEAKIVMIDCDSRMHLDHLKNSRCTNINYQNLDIFSPDFKEYLKNHSNTFKIDFENNQGNQQPPLIIALGIHLCGHLSTRMINLFNEIEIISILIMLPCCMPKRGKRERSDLMKTLRRNKWCNYTYWCLELYMAIEREKSHKNISTDSEIESEKSTFITAMKRFKSLAEFPIDHASG